MNYHAEIMPFLKTKKLSLNSEKSYNYDLQHFCAFFADRMLSSSTLELYRQKLSKLAPSAQKRKISAVNQFLIYLYQKKLVDNYYRLAQADRLKATKKLAKLQDLSSYYGPLKTPGQFIACLISQTGLTPSEICQLSFSNFNFRFNVLEVTTTGGRRVIPLEQKFAVRAKLIQNADELFAKSRQYLHSELKKFTPLSARALREQYILRQVKAGKTIYELADLLGLKTTITLEKYYKK